MHGPPLLGWLLVALCAGTALACLLRARAARGEALMGAGMALMAVPVGVMDPRPWGPALFTAVFAAVFALAARRTLRRTRPAVHHAHHAVGALAMVYMAVAMGGAQGGHTGHGPAGTPSLTGLLLLYYAAYVLATGARLVSVPVAVTAGGPPAGIRQAPELAAACRVSMAIGMFVALLAL